MLAAGKKANELNHPVVFDPRRRRRFERVDFIKNKRQMDCRFRYGNRHCRSNFPASLRYNRFSVFHRLGIRSDDCNSNCRFLYFKERQRRKIV